MEPVLDSCQDLRVLFKDFDNVSVSLFDQSNRSSQLLSPLCQASTLVRSSEEGDCACFE
jgi:hypothetical protein